MSSSEVKVSQTNSLIDNKEDWYPEAWAKLTAVADSIKLDDIQIIDLEFDNSIHKERIERLMRFAAAQALLDNIAVSPKNIVLRLIIPHIDFRTTLYGDEIPVGNLGHWWQPTSGVKTMDDYRGEFDRLDHVPIYFTNRNAHNDRKVMIIYAHQDVGYNNHHVKRITIERDWVATLYQAYLTPGNAFYETKYPILAKRGDNLKISFDFTDKSYVGSHTNIKFFGIVAEATGAVIIG